MKNALINSKNEKCVEYLELLIIKVDLKVRLKMHIPGIKQDAKLQPIANPRVPLTGLMQE